MGVKYKRLWKKTAHRVDEYKGLFMIDLTKIRFWAKTDKNGDPGIDVYHHMMNVGMVAKLLASDYTRILDKSGFKQDEITILAGLHDIGKMSPQFQRKCKRWLEKYSLIEEDGRSSWQSYSKNHAVVSQFTIEKILKRQGLDSNSSSLFSMAIGAHHGTITYNGERGLVEADGMREDDWQKIRESIGDDFVKVFGQMPLKKIKFDNPLLWWIAGLTTVADWIGSDEHFFPEDKELSIDETSNHAKMAVENIGFYSGELIQNKKFESIFPFIKNPNSLQISCLQHIKKPGIYIIEAPMGMGKTEAALAVAYSLLDKNLASGIYFALPTQVTSNRIHLRVKDLLKNIIEGEAKTRLIHGNSWLVDEQMNIPEFQKTPDSSDPAIYDWFASSKRALLSRFGVGTADQALLGVIAVKHFFVRQFALAGKVVILDEVHSYDMYTGTLIEALCKSLVKLGSTVIILSATLTKSRRNAFLGESDPDSNDDNMYPLISGRTEDGELIDKISVQPPADKEVGVKFCGKNQAISEVWDLVGKGASVLWICDTVAESQNVYDIFKALNIDSDVDVGLLHSRFPFFQREKIEAEWLERLGKNNSDRKPCILVSTQIVEQSVDIDADLIVTELAPTDMLLQRIGRLWRHERGKRPVGKPEVWILGESFSIDESYSMTSRDIQLKFGGKAYVYDPYVLLRTRQEWEKSKTINIPSEIRTILENTYSGIDELPESWKGLEKRMLEMKDALVSRAVIAKNVFRMKPLDDDVESASTRVNGQPTISILIVKATNESNITLLDDSEIPLPKSSTRKGSKDKSLGKSIHRNIVKAPFWPFEPQALIDVGYISEYINRYSAIAFLGDDGFLNVSGLKKNIQLRWSFDKGLEIIKPEAIEDESVE